MGYLCKRREWVLDLKMYLMTIIQNRVLLYSYSIFCSSPGYWFDVWAGSKGNWPYHNTTPFAKTTPLIHPSHLFSSHYFICAEHNICLKYVWGKTQYLIQSCYINLILSQCILTEIHSLTESYIAGDISAIKHCERESISVIQHFMEESVSAIKHFDKINKWFKKNNCL